MSKAGYERAGDVLHVLLKQLRAIKPDIGPSGGEEFTGEDDASLCFQEDTSNGFDNLSPVQTNLNSRNKGIGGMVVGKGGSVEFYLQDGTAAPVVDQQKEDLISREPPERAKPKGRTLDETEKKNLTLGAKGSKKCVLAIPEFYKLHGKESTLIFSFLLKGGRYKSPIAERLKLAWSDFIYPIIQPTDDVSPHGKVMHFPISSTLFPIVHGIKHIDALVAKVDTIN
ncbi:hypothetical protein PR202_gb29374 [Eleusine coracana subsp. coracana]|uniref:Uncharacterized protein n=1 Tax=Eleusine coracana subsp. coracana TaxID=191504 RepID=A0AAV5FZH8_ELECO|nr:hypothetical protein PR202_gb29374 [Eleusine coracana subsp. coracana]